MADVVLVLVFVRTNDVVDAAVVADVEDNAAAAEFDVALDCVTVDEAVDVEAPKGATAGTDVEAVPSLLSSRALNELTLERGDW